MLLYELSGSGFDSCCSHLNFRFRICFEQGVPWHSGNHRVWIHSETRTWHDRTYSQMHRTDKYSEHSSIICPVWPNGWVFFYELSGSGFEFSCSHRKSVIVVTLIISIYYYLSVLLHCSYKRSSWKIKLGAFKNYQKYFAKYIRKSWKPHKITITVGKLFN